MKHSLKERRIKTKEESLFYINGRKGELTCQRCQVEGASLWNRIPRPEGKGDGKMWGVRFFVFCFFLIVFYNRSQCHYQLIYDGQKDQIFILFTFQVTERYALTVLQKPQPPYASYKKLVPSSLATFMKNRFTSLLEPPVHCTDFLYVHSFTFYTSLTVVFLPRKGMFLIRVLGKSVD